MLKPPRIPETNHTLFYCQIRFAGILQRASVPLLMRGISPYSSFSDVLIRFWYRCYTGRIKQFGKCSLLCYFPQEFVSVCYYFLLRHLLDFTGEAIWPYAFLSGMVFDYKFNLFNRYGAT